jgi:hypothetical protein
VLGAGLVSFIPRPSRERETHTKIAEPVVELERGGAGRDSAGAASGEGSVQLSTLHSLQRLGRAGAEIVGVESVGAKGSVQQLQQLQLSTPRMPRSLSEQLEPFDDSLFLPFEAPAKA